MPSTGRVVSVTPRSIACCEPGARTPAQFGVTVVVAPLVVAPANSATVTWEGAVVPEGSVPVTVARISPAPVGETTTTGLVRVTE